MKKNQKIKCDVDSCCYNDIDHSLCNLQEIKVCSCNCNDVSCKSETICDSFEAKNKDKKE